MSDFVIDHRPDGTPVFVDREEHYLMHHGIPGQKWGKRNGPPYPLGSDDRSHPEFSLKENEKVFISGTSKLFNDDIYGRKNLPDQIKNYLDYAMRKNARILVGDCWGVDEAVQNYLAENSYKKVSIYVSGDEVRNNADNGSLNWKVHHIDSSKYEEGSKEWHAEKDKAMNREATSGLAVILEEGSSATRKNIDRFIDSNKNVNIFQLSKNGHKNDSWIYEEDYMEHSEHSNLILMHGENEKTFFVDREEYIAHYGIPGQKWGKRNGPPYPLDKKDYSREEKRLAKQDLRSIKRDVKKTGSLFKSYSYAANTNTGIKASSSESVYKAKTNLKRISNRESDFYGFDDRTKEHYRKDAIKKAVQGDKEALSIFGHGKYDSYDSKLFDNFMRFNKNMSIDDKVEALYKTDFLHIREESGHYASFQSYLRDKYKKTYAEHLKQMEDADSDYRKALEDEVSSILKEYGDTVVSDKNRSETLSEIISKGIYYSNS